MRASGPTRHRTGPNIDRDQGFVRLGDAKLSIMAVDFEIAWLMRRQPTTMQSDKS
jgi:hypothetical protein